MKKKSFYTHIIHEIRTHENLFYNSQRLNQDICNLSTLCSEKKAQKVVDKEEVLSALRTWQKSGNLPEEEIVSNVISACNEVCFIGFHLNIISHFILFNRFQF
jgi:hypothetical protein